VKKKIKRLLVLALKKPVPYSLVNKNYTFRHNLLNLENFFRSLDYVYCNLNFDDLSPVFGEIKNRDYGGRISMGLTKELEYFLEANPNIAITQFVIPNFLGNTRLLRNEFLLTKDKYSHWIDYLTEFSEKFNIEYALHGLYHYQKNNPFFQEHTEFAFKNNEDAKNTIFKGISIFKALNWPITGFRQPGWDLSSEINLPEIAKELKLSYIASNSYDAGYNAGGIERVSNYYPTIIDNVINFPQNIELDWPIEKIYLKIDYLIKIKAMISIKGHFVNKGVSNSLTDVNLKKLYKIVHFLDEKYDGVIKYYTLNDLAKEINRQL